jgi:hypothetical protein
MTDRPILFQGDMVRALLAGTKTQTRRALKLPHGLWETGPGRELVPIPANCPYGAPGGRLWVRETWAPLTVGYAYRADGVWNGPPVGRWHPSIHMPRVASRILLEVAGVRVERVQAISEGDAIAEGVEPVPGGFKNYSTAAAAGIEAPFRLSARGSYVSLWDTINGDKPGFTWADNPWVWVVEFKRSTA